MSDQDQSFSQDDARCAMCGRLLDNNNRSESQPTLCKYCTGEEDAKDAIDDFK